MHGNTKIKFVSGQIYIPADLIPGEESPLPIEWKDGMDTVAMRRISPCAEKQTPVAKRETCLTLCTTNALLEVGCQISEITELY